MLSKIQNILGNLPIHLGAFVLLLLVLIPMGIGLLLDLIDIFIDILRGKSQES